MHYVQRLEGTRTLRQDVGKVCNLVSASVTCCSCSKAVVYTLVVRFMLVYMAQHLGSTQTISFTRE